jgi:MoaA/NifB/PqqE/SkfB family radical SAM enzyme
MSTPCILPFIHLETTTVGEARPCCMWEGPAVGNFNTQSLDEIWHGDSMQQLRNSFRAGVQPKGCENCWRAEAAGYTSKRINDNRRFAHHEPLTTLDAPVYLDLKLGSICNIKCRICSTEYSQKWAQDETQIYGAPRFPTKLNWLDDDSEFWDNLKDIAPTIEFIDFTGGEPFLVKPHWQLLKYLVDNNYSKNISVHYNTNGTVLPTTAQRNLWREFKWVETMFSFDGIDSKFEYQRHPAKWATAQQTFETIYNENVTHTTLCYTVNKFNVLYMQEFADWACKYNIKPYWNLLHGPEHYSIKNIPEHCKDEIGTHIIDDSIRNYMLGSTANTRSYKRFVELTQQLDSIRNETFASTFPELYTILANL